MSGVLTRLPEKLSKKGMRVYTLSDRRSKKILRVYMASERVHLTNYFYCLKLDNTCTSVTIRAYFQQGMESVS